MFYYCDLGEKKKTMRNQQLQTDYTEDMVGYWKERSHTYSKDNRSQLENEKKDCMGESNFI